MELFFREIGSGKPLIILHGLFGMSDNWIPVAKRLSRNLKVILVDLRNHGHSPHSDEFNYKVMADDVVQLINKLDLNYPAILGHSMGGKVAMNLALNYSDLIKNLIVVDIAPKVYYNPYFTKILDSLLSLNLNRYKSRKEIEDSLKKTITNPFIRKFLMKNIVRNNSHFRWRINLSAIKKNVRFLLEPIDSEKTYKEPTLFIKGERSDYITDEDIPGIKSLFPKAIIKIVPGAAHWVHVDAPEMLTDEILSFIK